MKRLIAHSRWLRTWIPLGGFVLATLLLSSCTKQIVAPPEPDLRSGIALLRAQEAGAKLVTNPYPGPPSPVGPVWATRVYPLVAGGTELEEPSLIISNDSRSLFLSLWHLPWQTATGNLKFWIGLQESAPALGSVGQLQRLRYPVTLTVNPGTECYCVEIGFAELADYLQADVTCNSNFVLVLQAGVELNGQALTAWAGDAQGSRGPHAYRWVSSYDAQCYEMPPPPENNR